jgi:recombination protein RecT
MSSQSLRARAAGSDVAQPQAPAQQPPSIGALIQHLRPEMQRALPKHMDADRMARIALTVLRKTPQLAQCTPESFMGALLTAAQLGLEFGAANEAYLTPYKREAQLIVGYQGYAKLFYQHPLAKYLDAQAVYERDEFDYAYGLAPFLRHKPAIGDRGQVVAYYAVASLTTGASAFVVMSPSEVRAVRGGKTGSNGGIADPMHWMERKTCIRQVLKLLPKSTEMVRAMAADEGIRTDLREDAIDEAPAYPVAITGVEPAQVEQGPTEGTVDHTTGEQPAPDAVYDPAGEPEGWDK